MYRPGSVNPAFHDIKPFLYTVSTLTLNLFQNTAYKLPWKIFIAAFERTVFCLSNDTKFFAVASKLSEI